MDRPLTTSDAAIVGNPGTGAYSMTAVQTGLFYGRQVQAEATPGLRFATGYGLEHAQAYGGSLLTPALAASGLDSGAGAFATANAVHRSCGAAQPVTPEPRVTQHPHVVHGPGGTRRPHCSRPLANGLATATDAPLTGRNCTVPPTPPPPQVKPSYQVEWQSFVDWCKCRNLQHWPASSATVAGYLEDRGTLVKGRITRVSSWILTHAQRAIGATHRTANLPDPCKSNLVKGTVQEMLGSTQGRRQRLSVAPGKPLDSATLTAIRQITPQAACHSSPPTVDAFSKQRDLIDAALCSLVLEARLGYAEAASLEWRDLTQKDDGTGSITVRKRGSVAFGAIPISKEAYDNLLAIADSERPQGRVFDLSAQQIGNRIRARGQAAGYDIYVTERRYVETPPGESQVDDSGMELPTFRYWQRFVDWCARRQLDCLPATPHTAALYFEHMAKSVNLRTLGKVGRAIQAIHRQAGYDSPFASPFFQDRYRHLCQGARQVNSGWLDASALEAVRATALVRRQQGRGCESELTARHRGLVNIALCSVMHEAGISILEASELRWRDIDESGEHGIQITVRKTEESSVFDEVIALSGQVVRDLQLIRGGAGPDDRVFGLSTACLYDRIRAARKAAGLDR